MIPQLGSHLACQCKAFVMIAKSKPEQATPSSRDNPYPFQGFKEKGRNNLRRLLAEVARVRSSGIGTPDTSSFLDTLSLLRVEES